MSAFKILNFLAKQNINKPMFGSFFGCTRTCFKPLSHTNLSTKAEAEFVTVHFKLPDGQKITTKAKVGTTMLDVVVDNNIGIDGFGACEGTLACSTCHLVFTTKDFEKIPNKTTDEELDMLDLAYGLTDTSRLGCQVIVTKDMEGIEMEVPAGIADARN